MAHASDPSARRFSDYLARLGRAVGHQDRLDPLRAYLTGLCLSGERKSIEPMAARVDPRRVRARHQSMHHFVANAPWDDVAVLNVARDWVLEQMERHGAVAAWVLDDTGLPKKGRHSVGVARQYCGALGKPENCQVAVSVSLANEAVSIPAAYRLYLHESWAGDRQRRRAAGVPDAVVFRTKWAIALQQIAALQDEGLPLAPVVADAGYGVVTQFRQHLTERGIPYIVGVTGETTVWRPGVQPLRARASGDPDPQDEPSSPHCHQRSRPRAPCLRLAPGDLAAGNARRDALALRVVEGQSGAPRREPPSPPGRGVAAHRVAPRRVGTDEGLALHHAARHPARATRPARQDPLAH